MRSLALALRGLWWRRWASLPILIVALACAAIAAAGPAYAIDSRDAVLQAALRAAPIGSDGTGIDVTFSLDEPVGIDTLGKQVSASFAAAVREGYVRTPIAAIEADKGVFTGGDEPTFAVPTLYRADACAHLTMVSGSCLDERVPLGVLVTEATARSRGWTAGTTLSLGNGNARRMVTVRGIYRPTDVTGPYWLDDIHDYFGQVALYAKSSVPRGDAMLVPKQYWALSPPKIGDGAFAQVDITVLVARLHLDNIDRFERAMAPALATAQTPLGTSATQPGLETQLGSIVTGAKRATTVVAYPIYVVAMQLVILTWLVLYLVLVSSADSRTAEVVLGKLRGLSPLQTVLHALLEPLLLMIVAVPLGAYLATTGLRAIAPSVLGPHVQLSVPPLAWYAALVAGLGGVVASALASITLLRRSVLDQWRHAERRPRGRPWAVDAVIGTLAAAGFVDLLLAPSAEAAADPNAQFIASLAPSLLAVALALLTVRLVPAIARAGLRRTRGTPNVVAFVAIRQIARRPGELRVFLLLASALALLVLGVSCSVVFGANQHDRALTEVGANRVLSVSVPYGADLDAVLAKLDPSGDEAAAVFQAPVDLTTAEDVLGAGPDVPSNPTLLVVDPDRFAKVAYWRPDFGTKASLADQLAPIRAAPPRQITFTATSLRLRVAITALVPAAADLVLRVIGRDGTPFDSDVATVPIGDSRTGAREVSLAFPGCAAGCQVRGFGLVPKQGQGGGAYSVTADITGMDAVGASGSSSVLPGLVAAVWEPLDFGSDGSAAESVAAVGDGLSVRFTPAGVPNNDGPGYNIVSGRAAVTPALGITGLLPQNAAGAPATTATASVEGGPDIVLEPTLVDVLPRAGVSGVLISRAWLAAALPFGYDVLSPNQVWLSADAPADFAAQLQRAGIGVTGGQSAAQREQELGDQGPSFAVAMLVFGAGAAGVLAVAGISSSLLIASRRRLYEMAALRSLGVSSRRVLASLVVEQLVVTAIGVLVGLVAGLVGARIALDKLPEYVDLSRYPPLLIDMPIWLCAGLAALVVFAVSGVVALGGLALVRRASPSRLREAQA